MIKAFKKIIAIMLGMTFLLPSVQWAFDNANYMATSSPGLKLAYQGKSLSIPDKYGTTVKAFQGQKRAVVSIQDLHCNYEVQTHIKDIISHLSKNHDLKLITQEGATGSIDTGIISDFPHRKIKAAVSDYFMKQGRLTGADVYAVNSQKPVYLKGIEDESLYQASLDAVHSFLNAQTQGIIFDLRDSMDVIKDQVYNKVLIKIDTKYQAYRHGQLDVYNYTHYLKTLADRLNINYQDNTNLMKLSRTNPDQLDQALDQGRLVKELDQLDQQIRDQLYTSDDQRKVDQMSKKLDIMEKLLNVSVTPEELETFRSNKSTYTLNSFLVFIKQQLGDDAFLFDTEGRQLDDQLKQVNHFYNLADARSIAFVNNLEKSMDETGETLAVMVNGGFHSSKVQAELESRQISYLSVRPHMTKWDIINPYFDILQNRKLPIEKLLEKNQNIIATRNYLQRLTKLPVIGRFLVVLGVAEQVDLSSYRALLTSKGIELGKIITPEQAQTRGLIQNKGYKLVDAKKGDQSIVVLVGSKPLAGLEINNTTVMQQQMDGYWLAWFAGDDNKIADVQYNDAVRAAQKQTSSFGRRIRKWLGGIISYLPGAVFAAWEMPQGDLLGVPIWIWVAGTLLIIALPVGWMTWKLRPGSTSGSARSTKPEKSEATSDDIYDIYSELQELLRTNLSGIQGLAQFARNAEIERIAQMLDLTTLLPTTGGRNSFFIPAKFSNKTRAESLIMILTESVNGLQEMHDQIKREVDKLGDSESENELKEAFNIFSRNYQAISVISGVDQSELNVVNTERYFSDSLNLLYPNEIGNKFTVNNQAGQNQININDNEFKLFLQLFIPAWLDNWSGASERRINISHDSSKLTLEFVDNGTQLQEDLLEKPLLKNKRNLKLQLPLLQKIAQDSGGEVVLKNNESGKGVTITVTFPIKNQGLLRFRWRNLFDRTGHRALVGSLGGVDVQDYNFHITKRPQYIIYTIVAAIVSELIFVLPSQWARKAMVELLETFGELLFFNRFSLPKNRFFKLTGLRDQRESKKADLKQRDLIINFTIWPMVITYFLAGSTWMGGVAALTLAGLGVHWLVNNFTPKDYQQLNVNNAAAFMAKNWITVGIVVLTMGFFIMVQPITFASASIVAIISLAAIASQLSAQSFENLHLNLSERDKTRIRRLGFIMAFAFLTPALSFMALGGYSLFFLDNLGWMVLLGGTLNAAYHFGFNSWALLSGQRPGSMSDDAFKLLNAVEAETVLNNLHQNMPIRFHYYINMLVGLNRARYPAIDQAIEEWIAMPRTSDSLKIPFSDFTSFLSAQRDDNNQVLEAHRAVIANQLNQYLTELMARTESEVGRREQPNNVKLGRTIKLIQAVIESADPEWKKYRLNTISQKLNKERDNGLLTVEEVIAQLRYAEETPLLEQRGSFTDTISFYDDEQKMFKITDEAINVFLDNAHRMVALLGTSKLKKVQDDYRILLIDLYNVLEARQLGRQTSIAILIDEIRRHSSKTINEALKKAISSIELAGIMDMSTDGFKSNIAERLLHVIHDISRLGQQYKAKDAIATMMGTTPLNKVDDKILYETYNGYAKDGIQQIVEWVSLVMQQHITGELNQLQSQLEVGLNKAANQVKLGAFETEAGRFLLLGDNIETAALNEFDGDAFQPITFYLGDPLDKERRQRLKLYSRDQFLQAMKDKELPKTLKKMMKKVAFIGGVAEPFVLVDLDTVEAVDKGEFGGNGFIEFGSKENRELKLGIGIQEYTDAFGQVPGLPYHALNLINVVGQIQVVPKHQDAQIWLPDSIKIFRTSERFIAEEETTSPPSHTLNDDAIKQLMVSKLLNAPIVAQTQAELQEILDIDERNAFRAWSKYEPIKRKIDELSTHYLPGQQQPEKTNQSIINDLNTMVVAYLKEPTDEAIHDVFIERDWLLSPTFETKPGEAAPPGINYIILMSALRYYKIKPGFPWIDNPLKKEIKKVQQRFREAMAGTGQATAEDTSTATDINKYKDEIDRYWKATNAKREELHSFYTFPESTFKADDVIPAKNAGGNIIIIRNAFVRVLSLVMPKAYADLTYTLFFAGVENFIAAGAVTAIAPYFSFIEVTDVSIWAVFVGMHLLQSLWGMWRRGDDMRQFLLPSILIAGIGLSFGLNPIGWGIAVHLGINALLLLPAVQFAISWLGMTISQKTSTEFSNQRPANERMKKLFSDTGAQQGKVSLFVKMDALEPLEPALEKELGTLEIFLYVVENYIEAKQDLDSVQSNDASTEYAKEVAKHRAERYQARLKEIVLASKNMTEYLQLTGILNQSEHALVDEFIPTPLQIVLSKVMLWSKTGRPSNDYWVSAPNQHRADEFRYIATTTSINKIPGLLLSMTGIDFSLSASYIDNEHLDLTGGKVALLIKVKSSGDILTAHPSDSLSGFQMARTDINVLRNRRQAMGNTPGIGLPEASWLLENTGKGVTAYNELEIDASNSEVEGVLIKGVLDEQEQAELLRLVNDNDWPMLQVKVESGKSRLDTLSQNELVASQEDVQLAGNIAITKNIVIAVLTFFRMSKSSAINWYNNVFAAIENGAAFGIIWVLAAIINPSLMTDTNIWLAFIGMHAVQSAGGMWRSGDAMGRYFWPSVLIAGIGLAGGMNPIWGGIAVHLIVNFILQLQLVKDWITRTQGGIKPVRKTINELPGVAAALDERRYNDPVLAYNPIGQIIVRRAAQLFRQPEFAMDMMVIAGPENNRFSVDAEMIDEQERIVLRLPNVYRRFLESQDKPQGAWATLRYYFLVWTLRRNLNGAFRAYIRDTKAMIKDDEAFIRAEYLGTNSYRKPINKIIEMVKDLLPIADYIKPQDNNRQIGVTTTQIIELLEAYREAIQEKPITLWSMVKVELDKLITEGQTPTSDQLVQALEAISLDEAAIKDKLLKQHIKLLQDSLESIRQYGDKEQLEIEVTHVAKLINRSQQGGMVIDISVLQQNLEAITGDDAKGDQVHFLANHDISNEYYNMAKALQDSMGTTGADALYRNNIDVLIELLMSPTYELNVKKSKQLQTLLAGIAQSRVTASVIGETVERVAIDQPGTSKVAGIVTFDKIEIIKRKLADGTQVEIAKPIITNVIANDADTIEKLNVELNKSNSTVTDEVLLIPFTGTMPKIESSNIWTRRLARRNVDDYLKTSAIFKDKLGHKQAIMQGTFRALKISNYMTPKRRVRAIRRLGRVLIRIMKYYIKQQGSRLQPEGEFANALFQMNNMIVQSSRLFGKPVVIGIYKPLGKREPIKVYAPQAFKMGEILALEDLWNKLPGEFILDDNIQQKIQRERLRNFRINSAA